MLDAGSEVSVVRSYMIDTLGYVNINNNVKSLSGIDGKMLSALANFKV